LQKLGLQDLAHVPTNLLLADFFADEKGLIGLDQFIKTVGGGSFASALSPSATNLVSSFLNIAESSTDAASRGRLSHAKLVNLLNQRLRNTGCSETFLRYSGSQSISFYSVAASLNSVWNSALIDQVADKTDLSVTPESFVCALRAFVENNSIPEECSKLAAAVADLPPLILQSSQVPYSVQSPQPPMSLASFDPLLGLQAPSSLFRPPFPNLSHASSAQQRVCCPLPWQFHWAGLPQSLTWLGLLLWQDHWADSSPSDGPASLPQRNTRRPCRGPAALSGLVLLGPTALSAVGGAALRREHLLGPGAEGRSGSARPPWKESPALGAIAKFRREHVYPADSWRSFWRHAGGGKAEESKQRLPRNSKLRQSTAAAIASSIARYRNHRSPGTDGLVGRHPLLHLRRLDPQLLSRTPSAPSPEAT
jgi:hypothetical protein